VALAGSGPELCSPSGLVPAADTASGAAAAADIGERPGIKIFCSVGYGWLIESSAKSSLVSFARASGSNMVKRKATALSKVKGRPRYMKRRRLNAHDDAGRFVPVEPEGAPEAEDPPEPPPAAPTGPVARPPSQARLQQALQAAEAKGSDALLIETLRAAQAKQNEVQLRTRVVAKRKLAAAGKRSAKQVIRLAAPRLYKRQRAGRPSRASGPGPKVGSLRYIASGLDISVGAAAAYVQNPLPEPAGDAAVPGLVPAAKRGGHNRRVAPECLALLHESICVRRELGWHVDQSVLVETLLSIEELLPELRPAYVARRVAEVEAKRDSFKSEDEFLDAAFAAAAPAKATVSELCFAMSVTRQRGHAVKRSRFRPTLALESAHFLDNVNRWSLVGCCDELGAHKRAVPLYSLDFAGRGGPGLLGEDRGPSCTFVVGALYDT